MFLELIFYFPSHHSEFRESDISTEIGSWSINMQYLIGLSDKNHVDIGIKQLAKLKSLAFWFLTAKLEKERFLDLVSGCHQVVT